MDFPAEKFVGKVVRQIENSADCDKGLHITFTDGTWIDVGFYAERAGEINYFSLPLPKMAYPSELEASQEAEALLDGICSVTHTYLNERQRVRALTEIEAQLRELRLRLCDLQGVVMSGGNRTIGLKGGKGAPGSGSRPKGSVEKGKWLCTQGAGYCSHQMCQSKSEELREQRYREMAADASEPPPLRTGGYIWKVENPEEVTLDQILTKWDEVRKDDRCPECGASMTSPLTARNLPGYPLCSRCGAVQSVIPLPKAKLVLVLEDNGGDEGCTHDVMQTAVNHGYKVLEARFENPDGSTLDVIHLAEHVTKEEGKC